MAWLLLKPVASSPAQHRQPLRALALPVSCDAALPDFIVKTDVFEKGMRRHWHQHDRFRMFFASSYGNKSSAFGTTLLPCIQDLPMPCTQPLPTSV